MTKLVGRGHFQSQNFYHSIKKISNNTTWDSKLYKTTIKTNTNFMSLKSSIIAPVVDIVSNNQLFRFKFLL